MDLSFDWYLTRFAARRNNRHQVQQLFCKTSRLAASLEAKSCKMDRLRRPDRNPARKCCKDPRRRMDQIQLYRKQQVLSGMQDGAPILGLFQLQGKICDLPGH